MICFDFSEDVYGKTVKVEFIKMLRPEMKFASIDELKSQMNQDKKTTKDYFNKAN